MVQGSNMIKHNSATKTFFYGKGISDGSNTNNQTMEVGK